MCNLLRDLGEETSNKNVVFLFLLWKDFTYCSDISIVDLEQV